MITDIKAPVRNKTAEAMPPRANQTIPVNQTEEWQAASENAKKSFKGKKPAKLETITAQMVPRR